MTRLLSALYLALPAAALADTMMQPGLWEITTRMEMPGMPKMQPMKVNQCISPAEAAKTESTLPKDNTCQLKNHSVTGNTVRWSVACKQGGEAMSGDGEMTYKGTSYDGTMRMKARGMDMTYRYSGKRIGDCKK
jgi:hypothetical protein